MDNGAATAAGPTRVEKDESPGAREAEDSQSRPGWRQLKSGHAEKSQAQGRARAMPSSEATWCTH